MAYLGLPFGLLPYLVLVLLTQRTVDAWLPMCDPCKEHWSSRTLVRGAVIVAGLVVAIVALALAFGGAPFAGSLLGLAGSVAVLLAWRRLFPPTRLRLRQIDLDGYVVFDGVSRRAAKAIEAMYAADDER